MVVRPATAARPEQIRGHNLSLVLGELHREGPLTRAQLTQRLGLSRSTTKTLVEELTGLNLVEEAVPTGGARVGRPSHVVTPHHAGPVAIAVDVDVEHTTIAAVGLGGVIRARRVVPTPEQGRPPGELVSAVVGELEKIVAPDSRVCGFGISVPGTVDAANRTVGMAPNLGWVNIDLGSLIADALPWSGVSVVVGNDADLAVLAEHTRGTARGCDDVVFLMGRIGVGAGVMVGGRPVRGARGMAGEIGHIVLDPAGPPCHCGKSGCLEMYVGEEALLRLAGVTLPRSDKSVAEVFTQARDGDPAARTAVAAVAASMGRAVAILINLLNPERVILGGSAGEVLAVARPELEAAALRYAFGIWGESTGLVPPGLGQDSALLGAAEVAFADLLGNPR